MRQNPSHPHTRHTALALLIAVLAFAALFMLVGPPRGQASGAATLKVSTAQNATLGKRVLVTSRGLTLYSLSAETRGRFICIGACLPTWPPLLLKGGAKPTGVRGLGSIRRPDGRRQVTYKGKPLYRFSGDTKKGDVNGEGFKDVGTWHAAPAPRSSTSNDSPPPAPEPTPAPAPTPGY
jgi:predicted lipoprotein with Yx(FWY)xxD motif